MGQHKYNPNCQLAREGKLPPKPKRMSKREVERLLYAKCQEILWSPLVNAYEKECRSQVIRSICGSYEKGGKK